MKTIFSENETEVCQYEDGSVHVKAPLFVFLDLGVRVQHILPTVAYTPDPKSISAEVDPDAGRVLQRVQHFCEAAASTITTALRRAKSAVLFDNIPRTAVEAMLPLATFAYCELNTLEPLATTSFRGLRHTLSGKIVQACRAAREEA